MGTNYYLHKKEDEPCPHCGRKDEDAPMHIGKSSGGWCFSLHVYPERGINTLEGWLPHFDEGVIKNEYGNVITKEEMLDTITDRGSDTPEPWGERAWFNYKNEEEFHRMNSSERGPRGLLRYKLSERCIGHGEGTYDYIIGEFF